MTDAKSGMTLDTSGIVDGQPILAASHTTPFGEQLTFFQNSKVSISLNDTHVGYLSEKLSGGGFSYTITSPAGDEALALNLDATGVQSGRIPVAQGDDTWSWAAPAGGGLSPVDIEITAGENLAERDVVYLSSLTAFKADADSTTRMGRIRGVVVESGGITSGNTGTVRLRGEVTGFSGLTPGGLVYASTTAGGYTQTKPEPSAGGNQVAVVRIGFATSATVIMVLPGRCRYMKRASLADDGTLTIQHYIDALARSRKVRGLAHESGAGATLTSYGTSNQDVDVSLRTVTNGKTLLAQSFQLSSAADVYSARVWLKQVGTATGGLNIQIWSDSGGDPDAGIATLGSLISLATIGSSYAWIEGVFSSPASLSAGTTYWLVVSANYIASDTDYVDWGADGSSPSYADGEMKSNDTITWNAENKDAVFEIIELTERAEPAVLQRWGRADTYDLAVRKDDGAGSGQNIQTTFKNVTGDTAEFTVIVELD